METVISTTQLTKRYGKTRAVTRLNINVNKGDIYGFIGSNGAGKSTTIRLLLSLISASSGKAEVFGLDVRRQKRRILSDIGYIPSETSYYPGMRVSDVLRMSANLRRRDCAMEAQRLCGALGLDSRRRVEELSFGNKKKVAIVLALQHKPDLLILDEATSGLDPLVQKTFWELLKQRHRQGATVFLSSHVLSEIQQYCTRAAIIREGRLVVEDSVAALSGSAAKRVTLHRCAALPEDFPGALGVTRLEDSVSFLFHGDYKKLLLDLQQVDFGDISITEPDMEEIFLNFYEKDGETV